MPVNIPFGVLGSDPVQSVRHVGPDVRIVVFVQREGAGGVLDEEVEEADFVGFELREVGEDIGGDEVAAAALRGEGELFLGPGHFVLVRFGSGWRRWGRVAGGGWTAGAGWEDSVGGLEGGAAEEFEGEEEGFEEDVEEAGEEGKDEDYEEDEGVAICDVKLANSRWSNE
ncbi:hypothetical protein LTR74_011692 [Friedmanniomyces endolithicus]|nr:hypothetical protein LTR74_011692 [Friedmanniomyces endolithicus]